MWDIKLLLLEFFFILNQKLVDFFIFFFELFNQLLNKSFFLLNWHFNLNLPQNLSFFFGLKFCLCISFLILIRGGTPRYRYDFLTKLGWLKFLSLIILIFNFSLLFFFFY